MYYHPKVDKKNSTMKSKADELLLLLLIILMAAATVARSDLEADEAECKDQLMSLTPCLGYVSGEGKTPTAQCCSVVAGKLNSTLKCMCILVKDRDEPGLGVKIDPMLALSLPNMCHSPSKASRCIGLLGLSPTSKEAQVFLQFDNTTSTTPNAATAAPLAESSSSTLRKWYISTKSVTVFICCFLFTSLLTYA